MKARVSTRRSTIGRNPLDSTRPNLSVVKARPAGKKQSTGVAAVLVGGLLLGLAALCLL